MYNGSSSKSSIFIMFHVPYLLTHKMFSLSLISFYFRGLESDKHDFFALFKWHWLAVYNAKFQLANLKTIFRRFKADCETNLYIISLNWQEKWGKTFWNQIETLTVQRLLKKYVFSKDWRFNQVVSCYTASSIYLAIILAIYIENLFY